MNGVFCCVVSLFSGFYILRSLLQGTGSCLYKCICKWEAVSIAFVVSYNCCSTVCRIGFLSRTYLHVLENRGKKNLDRNKKKSRSEDVGLINCFWMFFSKEYILSRGVITTLKKAVAVNNLKKIWSKPYCLS